MKKRLVLLLLSVVSSLFQGGIYSMYTDSEDLLYSKKHRRLAIFIDPENQELNKQAPKAGTEALGEILAVESSIILVSRSLLKNCLQEARDGSSGDFNYVFQYINFDNWDIYSVGKGHFILMLPKNKPYGSLYDGAVSDFKIELLNKLNCVDSNELNRCLDLFANVAIDPLSAVQEITQIFNTELLDTHARRWDIWIQGHGFKNHAIAGIRIDEDNSIFASLLLFFNKIKTNILFVSSCFIGGENKHYINRMRCDEKFNYTLIIGGINDSPTYGSISAGVLSYIAFEDWDVKSVSNSYFKYCESGQIEELMACLLEESFSAVKQASIAQVLIPGSDTFEVHPYMPSIKLLSENNIVDRARVCLLGSNSTNHDVIIVNPCFNCDDPLLSQYFKKFPLKSDGLDTFYPSFLLANRNEIFLKMIIVNPFYIYEELFGGIFQFIRDAFLGIHQRESRVKFFIEELSGRNDLLDLYPDFGDILLIKNLFVSSMCTKSTFDVLHGEVESEFVEICILFQLNKSFYRLFFNGDLKAQQDTSIWSFEEISFDEYRNSIFKCDDLFLWQEISEKMLKNGDIAFDDDGCYIVNNN